jgi:hypothetical protein
MAKRKPARRKREREWTHDQRLRLADSIEAEGALIRTLAKERFCAVMCYGQRRRFARCRTDDEMLGQRHQVDVIQQ